MEGEPGLSLARRIVRAYLKDDFILAIIYGPLRMGKSAYSYKVMNEVYQYLWDIQGLEVIKRFMGWHPEENVANWLSLDERIPCFTWDDAGYWLNSLNWNDPLLIAVQQYMNVVGTDMNALLLTTPDPTWILSKIRTMPGTFRVKIIKRLGGRSDAPSVLYARRAIGYEPYRSPDLKKTGVNKRFLDDFSCRFPDDVYEYYFPKRKEYARQAKLRILDELKGRTKIIPKQKARVLENIKNVEKEVKPE